MHKPKRGLQGVLCGLIACLGVLSAVLTAGSRGTPVCECLMVAGLTSLCLMTCVAAPRHLASLEAGNKALTGSYIFALFIGR